MQALPLLFNFVYTFLANSEPELFPADCPDVTLPVKYFPKHSQKIFEVWLSGPLYSVRKTNIFSTVILDFHCCAWLQILQYYILDVNASPFKGPI